MEKTMKFNFRFGEEEVALEVRSYYYTGNMYIGLNSLRDGDIEPFGNLTVNLDEKLPSYYAYVDTNNMPEAEQLIQQFGLGEPTGEERVSGFCFFPLYRFNKEKLMEYCPDDVALYENTLPVSAKRHRR